MIIEEVQKVPELIDEAQTLIVENQMQFILCGSSARKLKQQGANLLGGRALRFEMFPLVYLKILHFDLLRALHHGLLLQPYWHTTSQLEVDFILGDHEIAFEVKGRKNINGNHCKGLHAFAKAFDCSFHGEKP